MYNGGELTVTQCQSVLEQPRYKHYEKPSPEELSSQFRKQSEYPRYFIFEDAFPIAQIMAHRAYDHIMCFEDFWANNFLANLRFYRLTQKMNSARTPGYELILRSLHWGLSKGFEEVIPSMFVSKSAHKGWTRLISSGILIPLSKDGWFHCRILKELPDLLDLESTQTRTIRK